MMREDEGLRLEMARKSEERSERAVAATSLPQVRVCWDAGRQRVFVNGADVSALVKHVGVDFKTGEVTVVFVPGRIDLETGRSGT